MTFPKRRDEVNFVLDLSRLFRNVDMLEDIGVATGLNIEAANKMIDNLEKSLKLE